MVDDLDLIRARHAERNPARPWPEAQGSEAMLGKVTTANSLIGVGKFLSWHPVTITGPKTEGTAPTLTVDTTVTSQAELVQGVVAQNDIVLFCWADYHWVTDGKGSSCGWRIQAMSCNGALAGVLVELKQGGATVASGTTALGMVDSIVRTSGGSGGTDGTYTDGTFTGGGGSGATFSYKVVGGVVQAGGVLTILDPGSGYTSAPTPVFGPAAGAGAAATATVAAYVRFAVAPGTYDVATTPPAGYDFVPGTTAVAFSCPAQGDAVSKPALAKPAGFVCACTCQNPFPVTLYVEDDDGLHALPFIGFAGSQAVWGGDHLVTCDAATMAGCAPSTTSTVTYELKLDCTGTWTLNIYYGTICCSGSFKYGAEHTPQLEASGTAPYDPANCKFSTLTFTLPTTVDFDNCDFPPTTGPHPLLGGGGSITVSR